MPKSKPEDLIVAEHAYSQSKGDSFHLTDLNLGDLGIVGNSKLKKALGALIRAGYLTCDFKAKVYSWTPEAKAIKDLKITFVDQQPGRPVKEIGPEGVAAVIAGAAAASGSKPVSSAAEPKSGENPPPKRKYVRKPVATEPESPSSEASAVTTPAITSIPETPPAMDDFGKPLLTAPEGVKEVQVPQGFSDIHGFVAGDSPVEEVAEVVMDIPAKSLQPLILASDEMLLFDLLGEMTANYISADSFQGLGLDDASLDIFLTKMRQLCILADGPEVVGQEKVYIFSRLAYDQYARNFFQISTSVALQKIQADLQQLNDEREALQNQLMEVTVDAAVAENAHRQSAESLKAAQTALEDARRLLTEAENAEKEAQRRVEKAAENLQTADAVVTAANQEIVAADFDNRITELSALEETAVRLDQLHSVACQQKLLSYLLIPVVGKEVR
jgi:hypothetical protein